MAKYKSKIKDNQIRIRAKLSRKETLNEVELEYFIREHNSKNIRGLFRVKRLRGRKLEYYGPGGMSLSTILTRPVCKRDFFFYINLILKFSREMNKYALPMNKIVLDLHQIYYNDVTQELRFIYLPIEMMKGDADFIGLMEQIAYATKPIPQEDTSYVARFINFLAGLTSFNADQMDQYISYEVYGGTAPSDYGHQSNFIQNGPLANIPPYNLGGGGLLVGEAAYGNPMPPQNVHAGILEPGPSIMAVDTGGGFDPDKTGILRPMNIPGSGVVTDPEKTGYLNSYDGAMGGIDPEATGKLDAAQSVLYGMQPQNQPRVIHGRLCRMSTGENIDIDKEVFRVGKERSYVDYCVTNNGAVSRNHADIITRGNRHFVMDLNSKNRTFINGKVIPVREETEIFNGDSLRLANEEFVFYA